MDGETCKEVRLAAGAVGPRPMRLRKTEALLRGMRIDTSLLEAAQAEASAEVSPITDIRSEADYRRRIVGVYTRRALESISTGGPA